MATLNIQHGSLCDFDMERIAGWIAGTGAHAVALQEVDDSCERSRRRKQLEDLCVHLRAVTRARWVGHFQEVERLECGGTHGNGILLMEAVADATVSPRQLIMSHLDTSHRGALAVPLLDPSSANGSKKVWFVSTRTSDGATGFAQACELTEWLALEVAPKTGVPVVLSGDMGCDVSSGRGDPVSHTRLLAARLGALGWEQPPCSDGSSPGRLHMAKCFAFSPPGCTLRCAAAKVIGAAVPAGIAAHDGLMHEWIFDSGRQQQPGVVPLWTQTILSAGAASDTCFDPFDSSLGTPPILNAEGQERAQRAWRARLARSEADALTLVVVPACSAVQAPATLASRVEAAAETLLVRLALSGLAGRGTPRVRLVVTGGGGDGPEAAARIQSALAARLPGCEAVLPQLIWTESRSRTLVESLVWAVARGLYFANKLEVVLVASSFQRARAGATFQHVQRLVSPKHVGASVELLDCVAASDPLPGTFAAEWGSTPVDSAVGETQATLRVEQDVQSLVQGDHEAWRAVWWLFGPQQGPSRCRTGSDLTSIPDHALEAELLRRRGGSVVGSVVAGYSTAGGSLRSPMAPRRRAL